MGLLVRLAAGPLLPDPPTARDWLHQELLGGEYRPSLVQQVKDWVSGLLGRAGSGTGLGALGRPALLLLVLAVLVGLALVASRLRRNPRSGREPASVFDDVRRSAAEHRRLARAAFDEGDWDAAVVEGMRALTAGLVERHLVEDLPAATAHEVTTLAAPRLPTLTGRFDAVARIFDETRYGDRRATRDRATTVLDLDRDVAAASPASLSRTSGPVAAVPR